MMNLRNFLKNFDKLNRPHKEIKCKFSSEAGEAELPAADTKVDRSENPLPISVDLTNATPHKEAALHKKATPHKEAAAPHKEIVQSLKYLN